MPSVSRSQQAAMAIAYEKKKSGKPVKGSIGKMPISTLKEFASTSTKGLPKRVGGKK